MPPTVPSEQSTLSALVVLLSTFGGLILVLTSLLIIISVWCLRKRNKKFKGSVLVVCCFLPLNDVLGPIMDNPAYGQGKNNENNNY